MQSAAPSETSSAAAIEAFGAGPNGVPIVWVDPWSAVVAGGHQYAEIDEHPAADYAWREVLVARDDVPALVAAAARGDIEVAGTLAAEALRIAAWRPRLATERDDRLIPHEVDWMRSAVHLNKGCYRGQETVAKVHNLGHPPRRLVMLHLDGSDAVLPAPGDEVFVREPLAGLTPSVVEPSAGEPAAAVPSAVGQITASALHYELGPIALAIVKRTTPVDAELVVASEGILVPAAQEVIVPPEAGAAVGRIPRLPRLGAQRR